MNVYEQAYNLEKAIKASDEYSQYAEAKEDISKNEEIKAMLDDFRARQMNIQAKQMMGEEVGNDMIQSLQNMYEILSKDPMAAHYLQCEMRFSLMMQDVVKILGELMGVEK